MKSRILTKFIVFNSAVFLLLFVAFYQVVTFMQAKALLTHRLDEENKIGVIYSEVVKYDTDLLTASLDILAENKEIKSIYLENDRAKLLAAVSPLFQKLRDEYSITHFYFIRPDGTVFLRAHAPELFDDVINRATFKRAVETNMETTGIELGVTAFALRAVTPYYDGDKLIGYIELAEEIGHVLDVLRIETGDEFVVLGDKELIDPKQLQDVRRRQGLDGVITGLTDHVLVSETTEAAISSPCLTEANIKRAEVESISVEEELPNGIASACVGFALVGPRGGPQGVIFAIFDQTEVAQSYFDTLSLLTSAAAIVAILTIIFIYLLVSRLIIKPIKRINDAASDIAGGDFGKRIDVESTDEIGQLAARFNAMAGELGRKSAEMERLIGSLEETVESRTKEVRDSESKYRSLIESVQVCIKVMDRDLKIVSINRYGVEEHMLGGLSRKELHDYDILGTIVEADREKVVAALRGAFDGSTSRLEIRHVPGKSKNSHCLAVISPIGVGKIDQALFLSSDISGIKKAEEQVKELDMLKNKFIQVVSHQLRTPLSVVRWNLESVLAGEMGKLKEAQEEFLHLTYEANGEVISRIDDLLTALDIEEGKLVLTKDEISLEALAKSVFAEGKKKCAVKEIACDYSGPKKPLPAIQADAEKIRKVLECLSSNALVYTLKGGSIMMTLAKKGEMARFEIRDTGIGIPEEEQSQVFARFFRASNAFVVQQDASGLGLYIAKHFIEQHQGRIGFESKEGEGSSFWFELPLKGKTS